MKFCSVSLTINSYSSSLMALKIKYQSAMMTSSNGNIFPFVRGIHLSPANFPLKGQWRGALMFSLICALNKRLSKQSRGWWFETPSRSLWRQCNATLLQRHPTCRISYTDQFTRHPRTLALASSVSVVIPWHATHESMLLTHWSLGDVSVILN